MGDRRVVLDCAWSVSCRWAVAAWMNQSSVISVTREAGGWLLHRPLAVCHRGSCIFLIGSNIFLIHLGSLFEANCPRLLESKYQMLWRTIVLYLLVCV